MYLSEPLKKENNPYNRVSYKFAGHETFTFRYGWLKKAVDATLSDSQLFLKDHAIVELGVGKNMVKSIKYWALATNVLCENNKNLELSEIGRLLITRWDPYFEDPASLWLIHWLLATNPSRAAVWYLSFNKYPRPEFSKKQLLEYILNHIAGHRMNIKSTTIGRDIDCFIRTYLPVQKAKAHVEETYSCPLNELGLFNQLRDGESYQFNIGPKPSLPTEIVGYALLTYLERAQNQRKTISVSDCLYNEGSPGQVFKLDENSLVEYIELVQKVTDGCIEMDETAGLKQIYNKKQFDPHNLLVSYYR